MRTVAVIQARMGSSRLPGKVLLPLAGGRVIDHVVERASAIPGVDHVVVATSTRPIEDPLVAHVEARGRAQVVRGSESDCLSRFCLSQAESGADVLVRITADCPLLDPAVSGASVARFHDRLRVQRLGAPGGAWTPRSPPTRCSRRAAGHREHVTLFLWSQPEPGRRGPRRDGPLPAPLDLDTTDDLTLIERIYDALWAQGSDFTTDDVLQLLAERPTGSR